MKPELLEKIYQDIAAKINEMIPEKWRKVYVYAQVEGGFRSMYFYFYPIDEDEPVYGMDIVDNYSINEDAFDDLFYEALEDFKNLWLEFKKNGLVTWTNVTFILDNTGNLKIDYKYDDLSEADDYERHVIWRYEYLGVWPDLNRKRDVKILEEYLKFDTFKSNVKVDG